MNISDILTAIGSGAYDERLREIYPGNEALPYQKQRYLKALRRYAETFGEEEVQVYSAPGRSEICGNHTDHQQGEVIAAAIDLDAVGIVRRTEDHCVTLLSEGYPLIKAELEDLTPRPEACGTSAALIRGVAAGFAGKGYRIGGFRAYVTSDVLGGAGLSSSAAFEILIGTILSGLYNDGQVPAEELARIGQFAENTYFDKPCGLMDQMACAVGHLVHIDFADPQKPRWEKLGFDLGRHGYSLCVTDTGGSHADLTADYAAIPEEMKRVAAFFGRKVLLGLSTEDIRENLAALREQAGDRSVLRALHCLQENERVRNMAAALARDDIAAFLENAAASGNSSAKYLQNLYAPADVRHQPMTLALALSEALLGNDGVCRVHGGGFAGTVQAFVRTEKAAAYREAMDRAFGAGACRILRIRPFGGIRVL